ncbi:MAG TPA: DoxX family membrane protein [Pseudonocardiaceae bacterium]
MIDRWLARHSITVLRICMGVVIFVFGFAKYFPGVSPAQGLVLAVNRILTFGLMPERVTLILFATVESVLGLSLISGWGLRVTIYPLALWALAILSPLVLLTGELFSGPYHALTLLGQYVFKDIVLLASVLVIASRVRRGSRSADGVPAPRQERDRTVTGSGQRFVEAAE